MSKNKKISDEELEEEIQKNKTEKQIALDNGYEFPSYTLNERIKKLGYRRNQKLTLHKNNAATLYIKNNKIEELADQKDIDLGQNVFFNLEVMENGKAVLQITENSFTKTKKDDNK